MEVILLERVGRLGAVGDVVTVKNGYARNFLIPQGKVLRATAQNRTLFEERKSQIEAENNQRREEAEKVAAKINDMMVVLIRQCGEDGRLFGSVTARDIAIAVTEAGGEAKREHIVLSTPIKTVGIYPVQVTLHAEVIAAINVNVARTDTEATEAANARKKGAAKAAVVVEEKLEEAPAAAAAEEETGN